MEEQLIISLTSWPPRIEKCAYVLINIGRQIYNKNVRLVLVLSENEFKGVELPEIVKECLDFYNIELIWDKGNIKSHKKLLPTLEKYPNNSILVIDDDKQYPMDFVDSFLNDHQKYPNDIIVGGSFFEIVPANNRIACVHIGNEISIEGLRNQLMANQEITIEMPANGCFGELFPAHSFQDERFFDRDLISKYNLNSDEDWQFMFNIMENRSIRASSVIRNIIYDLPGSHELALSNINGLSQYEQRYNKSLKEFPEFYDKLIERYGRYNILCQ